MGLKLPAPRKRVRKGLLKEKRPLTQEEQVRRLMRKIMKANRIVSEPLIISFIDKSLPDSGTTTSSDLEVKSINDLCVLAAFTRIALLLRRRVRQGSTGTDLKDDPYSTITKRYQLELTGTEFENEYFSGPEIENLTEKIKMPLSWKPFVEKQDKPIYSEQHFQKAAMQLITEQVIYQSNRKQKSTYDLINLYRKQFDESVKLFGCELKHNEAFRYYAAVPLFSELSRVSLPDTLMALVLRKIYDRKMHKGVVHKGIAEVSINELEVDYLDSTNRELVLQPRTILDQQFKSMKRWGIARMVKGEDDVDFVQILPGIATMINEATLSNLKTHAESKAAESISVDQDKIQETEK